MSQKASGRVNYFDDNVVLTKRKGKGLKVGEFEETTPAKWQWRDITTQVSVRGTGPTDPSWSQIGSTAFYAYDFSLNDQCWMAFHIPHDIVPDSDVYFHTHWLPDGTNTNTVKWQYTYSYAKGFNQAAFDMGLVNSPLTNAGIVTAEEAGPGVAYQHMVSETAAVSIAGLSEPDGIVYVNVQRITNGGTNNTDGIFVLTSDIHYQSTGIGTAGRTQPTGFYE
jgi:hypothetical protein